MDDLTDWLRSYKAELRRRDVDRETADRLVAEIDLAMRLRVHEYTNMVLSLTTQTEGENRWQHRQSRT